MSARNVLKNYNLFVDGRGYAGQVENYKQPALNLKTEEWRGAGMDAPDTIDMGMEKLEAGFDLVSYDPDIIALFGLVPGGEVRIMLRAALQNPGGVVIPVVHAMRGKMVSMDPGDWKPGEKPTLACMLDLHFYSLLHGPRELVFIDVRNFIRRINGFDQLLAMRAAMGV